MAALLAQAEKHADVIFPGYTHLQRAQPVVLAHHLLAYFFALQRDWERLTAWHDTSWMPLGAGALAGVNYPLDREHGGRGTGVRPRSPPTPWTPSPPATPPSRIWPIAANCALTLSRLAEELVLWSTQEFGLATLPESWTSGSSIMPQKRNPDAAELVRAKAAGFLARLQGLGALLKGLPLAYNKDLQEDKLYVFGTKEELDLCLEAMTAMVAGLDLRRRPGARGRRGRLRRGHRRGRLPGGQGPALPRRSPGRRAAGGPARRGRTAAGRARLWPSCGRSARLFDEDYYPVVDLERVVAGKVSPGGTAPERVAEQLALARPVVERLTALARRLGSDLDAPCGC